MKIIDCYAHYEPGLLDVESILERMDKHSIHQTFLKQLLLSKVFSQSHIVFYKYF